MEGVRLRTGVRIQQALERFTGRGGRFVRLGDNLYAAAEDTNLLTDFIENPLIEDVSNLIDFVGTDDPEYVQLDEIEINEPIESGVAETSLSDTAPLLESATGTASGYGAVSAGIGAGAGAAAASGPGTVAVITGGVIAGGAIVIGTTRGIISGTSELGDTDQIVSGGDKPNLEGDHEPPIASIPGHQYIGPGNTITDTDPVDTDDSIARNHDIAYNNARTQEDVRRADDTAIAEFSNDFIEHGNVHSAIGAVGLGIKRVIETGTGVLYPSNLPTGE